MVTSAQLQSETWWGREIVPAALDGAFRSLCTFFGTNPGGGGTRGNELHLYGRHRSLEWCKNSRFCEKPQYGTTSTKDLSGNHRYIRAFDVPLPGSMMKLVSKRLDVAVRAGDLPEVAEWFGTIDGTHVTGWYEGRRSSSDSSHLVHVHVGVWTKYADDPTAMARIVAVMTGEDMPTVDEIWDEPISSPALGVTNQAARDWLKQGLQAVKDVAALRADMNTQLTAITEQLATLAGAVAAIPGGGTPPGGPSGPLNYTASGDVTLTPTA